MATLKAPFALDRSLNTTEQTPRNIADVLAEGLSHITGRTASEVEYDNTDSGLTADNVQDALDEIAESVPTLPTTDIQTAVDEFETYNGGLLSECKVALSPNQDLHGYSEPWVGGVNKNKLPLVLADIKSLNTTGTWSGDVYTVSGMTYTVNTDDGGNVTYIEANGTPSANAQLTLTNNTTFLSGSFIGNGCPSGGGENKYRIRFAGGLNGNDFGSQTGAMTADPNTAINVYIRVDTGFTADHLKFYPMIRLATESDATFEPYSNICPISGHTQVEVGDDGKNCLPNDATDQTVSGVAFKKNNNGSLTLNGQSTADWAGITLTSAKLLKAGTYTVSCPRVNGVDTRLIISYDGAEKVNTYNVDYKTFTLTEDKIISVRFVIRNSGVSFSNVTYYPMIELGSTATAYEPYNGYQVTVNLGGTYYSGTLDVVSGVFMVQSLKTTINDCISNRTTSYDHPVFYGTISGLKNGNPIMYSDKLRVIDGKTSASDFASNSENGDFTNNSYNTGATIQVFLRMDDYSDVPSLKSAIGDAEIVYELANPTPIQLSPTMVKALVGENHLSAPLEGQEITESKYKQTFTFDDVIAYIQSLS